MRISVVLVVEHTGASKQTIELAIEAVFDSMKAAMVRGERMEFRGFGDFEVRPRKQGVGRNPRTGEAASIAPGLTVRFKPGKELAAIVRPTKVKRIAKKSSLPKAG